MKTPTTHAELCITGAGLVTSVGHDFFTACSSIRAGLSRPRKLDNYYVETDQEFEDDDDGLVSGHPVLDGDPNETKDRIMTLVCMVLEDMRHQAGLDADSIQDIRISLALPEPERLKFTESEIRNVFQGHIGTTLPESVIRTYPNGHAGMIIALSDAAEDIRQGVLKQALIIGADSLIGFDDLLRYDKQERLKTILNSDGFAPGEAASAFLVENLASARKRKADIACIIKGLAVAHEEQPVLAGKTASGTGLSQAIQGVFHEQETPDITAVVSDLNGEAYRFSEWAMIQPGTLNRLNGEKKLICPARCTGDTGAASSGMSLCAAARAMKKGYLETDPLNPTAHVLVLSSSDTGERGAVLIGPYHTIENKEENNNGRNRRR